MHGYLFLVFALLISFQGITSLKTEDDDDDDDILVDVIDFVCIQDGFFPDFNCSRYYTCQNLTVSMTNCSSGHFDPTTGKCDPSHPCGTFNCSSSPLDKVAHTSYPRFYTFCPRPEEPLVVAACTNGYHLNITSQSCEPSCDKEEVIPDIRDCHFYFKCTKGKDSGFVIQRFACPNGQAYNREKLLCSEEKDVPDCQS